MTKHVYVGNLAPETTDTSLRALFEQDGRTVESVSIVSNAKGKPRGFAFVQLATEEEAQAAIAALAGVELDGKPLTVKEGQPRPEPRIAEAAATRGRGSKKGKR
jgi:RNA recognition motif-containing protein